MATTPRPSATLEALAARLTAMEAAHAREVASLRAELAAVRATPTRPATPDPERARRPLARLGRARSDAAVPGAMVPGRTSRRGMLGTAAKVAAATVAAGVLAEQVATRPAFADNLGIFSSSSGSVPAVSATGTNGGYGVDASSDTGFGVRAVTSATGLPAVQANNLSNTLFSVAVLGHSDNGSGALGPGIGVQGESAGGWGVYGTATSGTGVQGSATGGVGVEGYSVSGRGVYGTSNATAGVGVYGDNKTNTSGSVAVLGHSDDGGGGLGPGIGVRGETAGGIGVNGTATTGVAVSGTATGAGGLGVVGTATTSVAVFGTSGSGTGVAGLSTSAAGVTGSTGGSATGAYGVYGVNTSNTPGTAAVFGHSDDGGGGLGPGVGVQGETAGGYGVYGTATSGYGVQGAATTGIGAHGFSVSGYGVYAACDTGTGLGASSNSGAGMVASSLSGDAIQATGGGGTAVAVRATGGSGVGVYGTSGGGTATQAMYAVGTSGAAGLRATSDSGNGMVALSTSGTGLNVQSSTGSAVVATSNGVGYGLYLTATSGWAIGCVGRIRVLGNAVGTATLMHGTTSKTVSTPACSSSSQVILTPTSNPQVPIWAVAAPGSFTIHTSSAPSADITFSYLLIN